MVTPVSVEYSTGKGPTHWLCDAHVLRRHLEGGDCVSVTSKGAIKMLKKLSPWVYRPVMAGNFCEQTHLIPSCFLRSYCPPVRVVLSMKKKYPLTFNSDTAKHRIPQHASLEVRVARTGFWLHQRRTLRRKKSVSQEVTEGTESWIWWNVATIYAKWINPNTWITSLYI